MVVRSVKQRSCPMTDIKGGDETGAANISLWEPTKFVSGTAAKGTPIIYAAMNYRVNGRLI